MDEGPDKGPSGERHIDANFTHLHMKTRRVLQKMLLCKVLISLSLAALFAPIGGSCQARLWIDEKLAYIPETPTYVTESQQYFKRGSRYDAPRRFNHAGNVCVAVSACARAREGWDSEFLLRLPAVEPENEGIPIASSEYLTDI